MCLERAGMAAGLNLLYFRAAFTIFAALTRARGVADFEWKILFSKMPTGLRGLEVADLLTDGGVLNSGRRCRSLVLLVSGKIRLGA